MINRFKEINEEVIDEINSALNDSRGLVAHQRRLAFSLSLGAVNLIEEFLDRKKVLKSGAKINNLWLKKNLDNCKKLISNQIICSVEEISNLDDLLKIVYKLENKRNELAYGKKVSEGYLRKLINLFFELREIVKND